jgi:methyltransferase (TIGR00027 family)
MNASETAPSRTAMVTALARSLHLLHYGHRALLTDPYAWPLVGADADAIVSATRPLVGDLEVPLTTWLAARARLTEDWLEAARAEQYVVLGAGLDSFAWRQRGDIRVFEVDHPATQAWKRARTEELGMPRPEPLRLVPVDFERDPLAPALAEAGLDRLRPTFVSWLGVVPYLTRPAIVETLSHLPRCSLAVGYVPPNEAQDEDARQVGAAMEDMVHTLGEPFLTTTTPPEFAGLVAEAGFTVVEDVGAHDIEPRYGVRAVNYERMALLRNDA